VSTSTVQHAAATAVLAGVALLAAAPAYAGPVPVGGATGPAGGTAGPQSPRVVEREATRDLQYSPAPTPATTAQAPTQPATRTPDRSDPSSVPVTVFALLGGTLVVGTAGFTVYRYRHHAPAGRAATA